MCSYKVVTVEFKWFGLQNRIEKAIHQTYPRVFVKFHRETFCLIDKWFDLTLEDVRAVEEETADQLKKNIDQGSLRGTAAKDDGKKSASEDND